MHDLKRVARMHAGVNAAIMHVFSVREPGVISLARQFAAARRAILDRVKMPELPPPIREAFVDGPSLPSLKAQMRKHVMGDTRLRALRRHDLHEAAEREHYRELVVAAAEAALNTALEDHFYRSRRRTRWEEKALAEIKAVFDQTEVTS